MNLKWGIHLTLILLLIEDTKRNVVLILKESYINTQKYSSKFPYWNNYQIVSIVWMTLVFKMWSQHIRYKDSHFDVKNFLLFIIFHSFFSMYHLHRTLIVKKPIRTITTGKLFCVGWCLFTLIQQTKLTFNTPLQM